MTWPTPDMPCCQTCGTALDPDGTCFNACRHPVPPLRTIELVNMAIANKWRIRLLFTFRPS